MPLFENEQEKQVARIRKTIILRLLLEFRAEPSASKKRFIKAMAQSVAMTPLEVSNRPILQEGFEQNKGMLSFFQVKGQTLVGFMEKVLGNKKTFMVNSKIRVGNLWNGKKLNPDALMTLLHEFGHNAELYSGETRLTEQQKEQFADTLAVYTAKKLGFPREVIARALVGRKPFVGQQYHELLLSEALRVSRKEVELARARAKKIAAMRAKIAKEIHPATVELSPPQRMTTNRTGIKRPVLSFFGMPRPKQGTLHARPRLLGRRLAA